MSGDAATVTAWVRFEPGTSISQGDGFSLYPLQTGIAFENPNPFFPATQQIK
jgi:hypothetical protein